MKAENIFEKYKSHLNFLIDNELISENYVSYKDHYVCPVCITKFNKIDGEIPLTLEDAPQKSIGGTKNTLTCKKCNNEAGFKIDHHLVNRLTQLDNQKFEPGMKALVKTDINGKVFNGTLSVEKDGKMTMFHSKKNNNPVELENNIPYLKTNTVVDFNFVTKNVIPDNLDYAVLKTAYIILFQHTGYKIILHEKYDSIRHQILFPEQRIIPNNFYFFSHKKLMNDGVHFICEKGFEIIIVVFTARTYKSERNFCVFLPIPNRNYGDTLEKIFELKSSNDEPSFSAFPENINNTDYLFDAERIIRLENWFNSLS